MTVYSFWLNEITPHANEITPQYGPTQHNDTQFNGVQHNINMWHSEWPNLLNILSFLAMVLGALR
jgi:hypothetical protein